eukprot:6141272-Pyramimonas_sp.AAC.1
MKRARGIWRRARLRGTSDRGKGRAVQMKHRCWEDSGRPKHGHGSSVGLVLVQLHGGVRLAVRVCAVDLSRGVGARRSGGA